MLGFKSLKRILKIQGSILCCGVPLETATRYVGIADVVSGMMFFAVIFLHLNEVNDHVPEKEQTLRTMLAFLPEWLSLLILASHIIKFLMGILIYMGAVIKSRGICKVWLIVSGITSLFAFPTNIFHLYQMFIVYKFRHELKEESQRTKKSLEGKDTIILPDSIDAYIPTGENNNPIEGKYIGFGNTTILAPPVQECNNSELPSPTVPMTLQPWSLPTIAKESENLYIVGGATDTPSYEEDDDDKNNSHECQKIRVSSRFYDLVPKAPSPLLIPLQPSWKLSNVIPSVLVTTDENIIASSYM